MAQVKMDRGGIKRSVKPLLYFTSIPHSVYHERGSGDQDKSVKMLLGYTSGMELLIPNSRRLVVVVYIICFIF
jgi:hypothetical protein